MGIEHFQPATKNIHREPLPAESNSTRAYIDYNAFVYKRLCTADTTILGVVQNTEHTMAKYGNNVKCFYDSGTITKKSRESNKRAQSKINVKYFPAHEDTVHAFELFPHFAHEIWTKGRDFWTVIDEIDSLDAATAYSIAIETENNIDALRGCVKITDKLFVLTYDVYDQIYDMGNDTYVLVEPVDENKKKPKKTEYNESHLALADRKVVDEHFQNMVRKMTTLYLTLHKKLGTPDLFMYTEDGKYCLKLSDRSFLKFNPNRCDNETGGIIEFDDAILRDCINQTRHTPLGAALEQVEHIPIQLSKYYADTKHKLYSRDHIDVCTIDSVKEEYVLSNMSDLGRALMDNAEGEMMDTDQEPRVLHSSDINGNNMCFDQLDAVLKAAARTYYPIGCHTTRWSKYFVHINNNFTQELGFLTRLPMTQAITEFLVRQYARSNCSMVFHILTRLMISIAMCLTQFVFPDWTYIEVRECDAEFILGCHALTDLKRDPNLQITVFSSDSDLIVLLLDVREQVRMLINSNNKHNYNALTLDTILYASLCLIFAGSDYHQGVFNVGDVKITDMFETLKGYIMEEDMVSECLLHVVLRGIRDHCYNIFKVNDKLTVDPTRILQWVEELRLFLVNDPMFYKHAIFADSLSQTEFVYLLDHLEDFLPPVMIPSESGKRSYFGKAKTFQVSESVSTSGSYMIDTQNMIDLPREITNEMFTPISNNEQDLKITQGMYTNHVHPSYDKVMQLTRIDTQQTDVSMTTTSGSTRSKVVQKRRKGSSIKDSMTNTMAIEKPYVNPAWQPSKPSRRKAQYNQPTHVTPETSWRSAMTSTQTSVKSMGSTDTNSRRKNIRDEVAKSNAYKPQDSYANKKRYPTRSNTSNNVNNTRGWF